MKILHLAPSAPYNEGWGYQENLLTKYQSKLGHEVTLVITNRENRPNGKVEEIEPCDYMSPDGFRVIRLDYRKGSLKKIYRLFCVFDIYEILKSIKPDFIMIHGLVSFSVLQVKKYVRKCNPGCVVIADNHLDYNIGSYFCQKKIKRRIMRFLYKGLNQHMQKYYKKVFGVTPWRSEYANDIFGIKREKLDVLPAGADDSKVAFENRGKIRAQIRSKHGIGDDDFLIVTGGKIDAKKNIHLLMQAVSEMGTEKVKLLVFGDPADDIKEHFNKLAENKNINCIGWIPADTTYQYFLAADLMFFPGQHSVMWEQAVACGTPCVFKHYHAMHHCDVGGNCRFLMEDSIDAIKKLIEEIIHPDVYEVMLHVALSERRKQFLYSELAKKSLDV